MAFAFAFNGQIKPANLAPIKHFYKAGAAGKAIDVRKKSL